MKTKKMLKKENELLTEELDKARKEIYTLRERLDKPAVGVDLELQARYMTLIAKYNKLMDSCLSSETEYITYNGELYGIKTIDYHKDTESTDSINIKAIHVPREKGLINNLNDTFKSVAKEFGKIFFGNENM